MDLGLKGKTFIITGGSSGLGAATAEVLTEEGANVVICARDQGRLTEMASRLSRNRGEVEAVVADVTNAQDLEQVVSAAVRRFGRIDGVLNNAGAHAGKPFELIDPSEWGRDFETKVVAAARLVQLALPHLEASRGSVVNILSLHGKVPVAGVMPSSVSRGAGMVLTKTLSRELGPKGIRVNALLVGHIETDQWHRAAKALDVDIETVKREAATRVDSALGRTGTARELGNVAAFVFSERASYVTGTAINVDGGISPVL